jgi:hypothetical protein
MASDRAERRPLSRKLPRNLRRSALAHRVAERAVAPREAVTPTPSPATVDLPAQPAMNTLPPPSPAAAKNAYVTLLGFLALAVFAALALRRAAEGLPVPLRSRADLFALVAQVGPNARNVGARFATVALGEESAAESTPSDDDARPKLRREGHVSIPGGILVFPESFQPEATGEFDVYVHFHGNTAVVKESAETAKLDAAVAIINLGIGSAPYEEYYSVPGTYEELLADVAAGVERRGLEHARVRRVALGGWSAGYGAISTILQLRKKTDRLDAVLIYDGIHCGWEMGALNGRQMRPFADAAAAAARGEIYFGITHSDIDPKAYASTSATAQYLLDSVGATAEPRDPETDGPEYLELQSMKGAVAKRREKRMEPTSEAKKGSFHVLGYRGDTKEHHMAHLFQMGATLLPELAARWKR